VAAIRRFEDIQAWQKARVLVREIYQFCRDGPVARDFAFKTQICRAALSAMTNIAEGFARKTNRDFAHFLDMARGSCIEVQSLLYAARDIGYLSEEGFGAFYGTAQETAALVGGLTNYLRNAAAGRC
jgi:four helix bundle protein